MTKADAIVQVRLLGLDAITAEDLDDLATCDDAQLASVIAGWQNILAVRAPSALKKLGETLGKIADWMPIAGAIVRIAGAVA